MLPAAWFGYAAYSDDHGATWNTAPTPLPTPTRPSVVELADGRVMMVSRRPWSVPDRHYRVAYSTDRGETWSALKAQPDLPTWGCQGSIIRYTRRRTPTRTGCCLPVPPTPPLPAIGPIMTVYLSYDEGRTWPVSKVLTPGYGGYSSLAVLPDMTIACLYETAGTSTITLARFDLKWLTDGKDSS